MNLYYLAWIGLLSIGVWVSLYLFLWAFKEGQFHDQERACYLPLRDDNCTAVRCTKGGARREVIVALGIIFVGVSGMIAVVITILTKGHGV